MTATIFTLGQLVALSTMLVGLLRHRAHLAAQQQQLRPAVVRR